MDPNFEAAKAELAQLLDGFLDKIANKVWHQSYLDDSQHQGAGEAALVICDTSRRTEKIQGLWEQVGVLNAKVDALTDLVNKLLASSGN